MAAAPATPSTTPLTPAGSLPDDPATPPVSLPDSSAATPPVSLPDSSAADPPVTPADSPPDGPATRLVGIAEASIALGISQSVIRRRLKEGRLRGERRHTPQGHVWLVHVPVPVPVPPPAAAVPEE